MWSVEALGRLVLLPGRDVVVAGVGADDVVVVVVGGVVHAMAYVKILPCAAGDESKIP